MQPIDGIDYHCPEDEQIDGLAEPTFLSEDYRNRYGESQWNALFADDEQYFQDRSLFYQVARGNARTYVDYIEDGAPNGKQHLVSKRSLVSSRS